MKYAALALAIVCLGAVAPCSAMEYPLTATSVAEAKQYSEKFKDDPQSVFSAYTMPSAVSPWPGFTPTVLIETPFIQLAFAYANATAKYEDIDPKMVKAIRTLGKLRFSVDLFNPTLDVNNDAVGIIKQNGKVIHSLTRHVGDQKVVDFPEVGYRTPLEFEFDPQAIDLTQDFLFVVADVPVRYTPGGEVVFVIDLSTIR